MWQPGEPLITPSLLSLGQSAVEVPTVASPPAVLSRGGPHHRLASLFPYDLLLHQSCLGWEKSASWKIILRAVLRPSVCVS